MYKIRNRSLDYKNVSLISRARIREERRLAISGRTVADMPGKTGSSSRINDATLTSCKINARECERANGEGQERCRQMYPRQRRVGGPGSQEVDHFFNVVEDDTVFLGDGRQKGRRPTRHHAEDGRRVSDSERRGNLHQLLSRERIYSPHNLKIVIVHVKNNFSFLKSYR